MRAEPLPTVGAIAQRLGADQDPESGAAALEFALEGLHLSRRLNKSGFGGDARYRGRGAHLS